MVTRSSTMKDKGQITVPVEIRRKHDLHTGSRLVFEDRGDYIAVMPARSTVDRLAGSLAEYAAGKPPLDVNREEIWEGIASERWERLQAQIAEDSPDDRG